MAPKARAVTAKALQALLTRIGSASSGTKDVLQERFRRDVVKSHLHAPLSGREQRQSKTQGRKLNIVSIDMGIKNLAYCHVEVAYPDGNTTKPTMNIITWDKLNLVDASRDVARQSPALPLVERETKDADDEVDPYSLSVLSRTAYSFIQKPVLEVNPDIILIERQRWRSASSAAIQQWTVRVNTLEAMLWAVLETTHTQRSNTSLTNGRVASEKDFEVFGVDPKRVGQYWLTLHAKATAEKRADIVPSIEAGELGSDDVKAAKKKEPRSKAEKKAKIALLRSWLTGASASTASTTPKSTPTIAFTIGPGAVLAREALRLPTPRSTQKRKKAKPSGELTDTADDESRKGQRMKKLDDITDCFLQAAAWVAWESNRVPLMAVWERRKGNDGSLPPLDQDILLDIAKEAGEL